MIQRLLFSQQELSRFHCDTFLACSSSSAFLHLLPPHLCTPTPNHLCSYVPHANTQSHLFLHSACRHPIIFVLTFYAAKPPQSDASRYLRQTFKTQTVQ